jgi:hypothetical protein
LLALEIGGVPSGRGRRLVDLIPKLEDPDSCYVALEGTAPKRVAITEFDSLEQAEAFYKSKAWTDLASERNKAVTTIKRYAVEVLP